MKLETVTKNNTFSFEGPVDIILALTLVTLKLTSMNNDYFNQYKKKLQLHFFFTSRPHGDHVSVNPILGILIAIGFIKTIQNQL